MKNIHKNILAASFLLLIGTACDKDENLSKLENIKPSDVPQITLVDVPTGNTTIEEDDISIIIPVKLDKSWDYDSEIFIEVVEGTATEGLDFDISSARIENGETEGEIEISIHWDDIWEETETVKFRIVSGPNLKLASNPEFTVTITNYVSPDLDINVSWAGTFNGLSATQLADFDVYISNSEGEDVGSAESSGFENLALDGTLPDGEYTLYAYLYSAKDIGEFPAVNLPLTVTFSREGVFHDLKLPQNEADVITTDDVDSTVNLAVIVLENGVFTIKTYGDDPIVIGSGRIRSN